MNPKELGFGVEDGVEDRAEADGWSVLDLRIVGCGLVSVRISCRFCFLLLPIFVIFVFRFLRFSSPS